MITLQYIKLSYMSYTPDLRGFPGVSTSLELVHMVDGMEGMG